MPARTVMISSRSERPACDWNPMNTNNRSYEGFIISDIGALLQKCWTDVSWTKEQNAIFFRSKPMLSNLKSV